MKKIFYAIISCFIMSSCSGMLDIDSHSGVAPDNITEKDLSALRMGMYNKVQNSPERETYILFDLLGGNLKSKTGSSLDLINNILSPLNSIVSSGWNGCYNALYHVNNVISIVEAQPESELKNTILGEAHYFRAYLYRLLVTRWGGVPLIKKNTLEKLPRESEENIWMFIEEELNSAISLLNTSDNYFYLSKDAATALMARVKLETGKYDEAYKLAESLITSDKYALDNFDEIFRGKDNNEVIFSFSCRMEESNITLSTMFYTYAHPNKGSYIYEPDDEVMLMYDDNDKRKDISITYVGSDACINKYPSGQTGTDPVVISRLAEMYLISAEAQGLSNGLGRLNELRKERGLDPVSPKNEEEFLNCILDERRKEFLAEGYRYYDLVRTNKAQSVLNIKDYQTVLPIPGKELILNTNLEPNPGY